MKERLNNFRAHLASRHPFIESLLRVIKVGIQKAPETSFNLQYDLDYDPAKSDYLPGIYFAPGELDEDYLIEPKRSSVIEFAAKFGKDIIHLPAKPKGRVIIGVGVAAMLIAGAKVIYDHRSKAQRED